jgi:hypothetical protein
MKVLSSLFVASSLVLAACGTDDKKDQAQPTKPVSDETATATATETQPSLPTAAMVRVPVDANGVEDTSKVEMRLDRSDVAAEGQDGVVAAWDKGLAVESVKSEDELDSDSSSQSWFFFRRSYGYGYGHGYGYGYGNGYGYGHRYYPSYRHYGHNYYYNSYPSYYGRGGYNYYYYPRSYGY